MDAEGLLVDTGGVFMLMSGHWRCVHVCLVIQVECSCLLVDTGGLSMSVSGC